MCLDCIHSALEPVFMVKLHDNRVRLQFEEKFSILSPFSRGSQDICVCGAAQQARDTIKWWKILQAAQQAAIIYQQRKSICGGDGNE